MKYLKSATLKNFQSHKDSFIEFDENLNVIVGSSDSGKSAIIRGIKWALYNEPAGDFFIKEGESQCSVTLEFSDNTKVKRIRGKSKNTYILYKNNGEEFTFEGFGTKVPQEIVDEIGISKIYLDSSSTNAINLGEQLEGAFLLSEKSSVRASAIGRIIGVNIIDDSLRETLRDVRNHSNLKKNLENSINKSEKELKEYDYLDDLSNKIDKAESINNFLFKKIEIKTKLKDIYESYKHIKIESKQIQDKLYGLRKIDKLNNIANDIEISYKDLEHLKRYNVKMNLNNEAIDDTIHALESLKNTKQIQDMYKNLLDSKNKRNILIQIKGKKDIIDKDIIKTRHINDKLKNVPVAEKNLNLLTRKNSYLINLIDLKEKLEIIQNNIQIGSHYLKNLEDINMIESIYVQLQNRIINIGQLINSARKLSQTQLHLDSQVQILKDIDIEMKSALNKYKNILSNQEVCPFCFSTIDDKQVEHIMKHYH